MARDAPRDARRAGKPAIRGALRVASPLLSPAAMNKPRKSIKRIKSAKPEVLVTVSEQDLTQVVGGFIWCKHCGGICRE